MSDFDSFLHREIHSGREFDKLIPKSTCKKVNAGIGDTDHSIEKMVVVVESYSWQMAKVAAKLQKSSLRKTTDAIYDFLYNHFQYKADGAEQMLRSPACSWYDRYNGIDCKSYSILASCILTEMDLYHYIRKVKQPGYAPDDYTHVYVIIPVDQESGSLNAGYYVIDGTVHDNKEVRFIYAKDEFMQGLQHSMLNAPAGYGLGDPLSTSDGGSATSTGTSGSTWNAAGNSAVDWGKSYVKDNSKNWVKKINFKSIGKIFNFRCLGGEALDNAGAQREIDSIAKYAETVVTEMNEALRNDNMTLFNQKYNEYHGLTGVLVLSIVKKLGEGWNGCTRENMVEVAKATGFYFDGAFKKSLDAWTEQYFNVTTGPKVAYSAQTTLSKGIMPFCSYTLPLQGWQPESYVLTKKPMFEQVPNFLVTSYTFQMIDNAAAFNPQSFLDTLQQAYNVVTNPGSVITGTGNSSGPGTTTGTGIGTDVVETKPTQASLGVLGYIIAAGGLWWVGMELFRENKGAKKSTVN